jgi:hypothetical protein
MIDYTPNVVATLNTILPTYYEMTLHSGIKTPCLSYMEINNYSTTDAIGATVGYSRITFQVKVWGKQLADLQKYALQVDDALRTLGFKRISSGELYDKQSTMIQKILTYEALALEEFKEAK